MGHTDHFQEVIVTIQESEEAKMESIQKALSSPQESERLYAVQDILDLRESAYLKENAYLYAATLVRHLAIESSQAVRESIVYALKRMPCSDNMVFSLLFELFQNADAYLRNAAVTIFGTKQTSGVAFLTSQLDHADREVRKLLMDALFQIGSKEAVLAIRAGLHDPSINVRITALEYLGQLNDRDSITDVLDMLQSETDPMLITSALESVLQIGDDASIQETIRFLNNNDDILKVHPVFLPELIKLISRSGTVENLLEIIAFLNGRQTYAKDIVLAIEDALKRHGDILCQPEISSRLIRAIKEIHGNEGVRYAAAELLLSEEGFSDKALLLELGQWLIKEGDMVHAGVRFLAKSGTEEGRSAIQAILTKTKDPGVRDLCEELI